MVAGMRKIACAWQDGAFWRSLGVAHRLVGVRMPHAVHRPPFPPDPFHGPAILNSLAAAPKRALLVANARHGGTTGVVRMA